MIGLTVVLSKQSEHKCYLSFPTGSAIASRAWSSYTEFSQNHELSQSRIPIKPSFIPSCNVHSEMEKKLFNKPLKSQRDWDTRGHE